MEGSCWCQINGAIAMACPVCEHRILDGPPWPKTVGSCDLLGTPYAPVSKTLSVNVKESTGIREDASENSVTL